MAGNAVNEIFLESFWIVWTNTRTDDTDDTDYLYKLDRFCVNLCFLVFPISGLCENEYWIGTKKTGCNPHYFLLKTIPESEIS